MPDVPIDQLTTKQAVRYLVEWSTHMSQEIEDLKAEVQAETEEDVLTAQTIADQQARIAELEAAIGAAEQAAEDAKAAQSGAEADRDAANQALTDALAEVRAQVDALKADNPTPEPDPNA